MSPKLRLGLILGLAAIALAGLGVGIARTVGDLRASSVERFLDNVYVNGVDLSGQTYEDGVALVAQEKDITPLLRKLYAVKKNILSPEDCFRGTAEFLIGSTVCSLPHRHH